MAIKLNYKSQAYPTIVFFTSIHEAIISINDERFRFPEALFSTSIDPYGNMCEFEGIHQALFNSIRQYNNDVQKKLYNTILLTVGLTQLQGIPERLDKEISLLVPPETKLRMKDPFLHGGEEPLLRLLILSTRLLSDAKNTMMLDQKLFIRHVYKIKRK